MTVSSENRKAGPFLGNDVATTFPFVFKVFSASDIRVVRRGIDGAETDLVLNESYAVTLNEDQNAEPGGEVTLTDPLATDFALVITSSIDYLQPTELTNQGGFYPRVISDALDRLTIQAQQIKEQVDRSAKMPITSADDPAGLADAIVALAAYADDIPALAADAQTALTSAATATTQAGIATTKAGEASDSADAAEADRILAQSAKTDAEAAQGIAEAAQGIAETQATIATTKAGEAAASAAAALLSENAGAVSAAAAGVSADISAAAGKVFASAAAGVGNGVAGVASLVAGSGGTDGTFALAFSGGTQVIAPVGYFVVAGGAVVQVVITQPGYYSAGTPTISFAASSGLTGASATAVMAVNVAASHYYWVPSADGAETLMLYRNVGGVATDTLKRQPSAAAVAEIDSRIGDVPGIEPAFAITDDSGYAISYIYADGSIKTNGLDLGVSATDSLAVADANGFISFRVSLSGVVGHLGSAPPAAYPAAAPNYGGQLQELQQALTDPLTQFIGVALVGDSITWGMTATGIAVTTPRSHSLADTRNNATSPTWANLLHAYMGGEYYEDASVTASGWPGSSGGVAQFEYSKTLDLATQYKLFTAITTNQPWVATAVAGSTLGITHDATTSSLSDNVKLEFVMTGYEFDLVFSTLTNGAQYELLLNEVSQGTFSTDTASLSLPAQTGNVRTHSFGGFKKAATVCIRIIPSATTKVLRLESIRINRKLRVTNNGVIGVNTKEYLTSLLAAAVRSDDSFVFVQLGTNDRSLTSASGVPESMESFGGALRALVDNLDGRGMKTVLMCANACLDNSKPTNKYDMSDVRAEILAVARSMKKDFIDQFSITRRLVGTTTFTADGLHPDDYGHSIMFNHIRDRIEGR